MSTAKQSAGLLLYRRLGEHVEVFLVHPGGPFFVNRDLGSWSIPKGEFAAEEDPLSVARREFAEETGQAVEACARGEELVPLGTIRQKSGKTVHAWALEGDWPENTRLVSNTFPLEWPAGSGRRQDFPEVDRGEFFSVERAREKINPAQWPLIERLIQALDQTQ